MHKPQDISKEKFTFFIFFGMRPFVRSFFFVFVFFFLFFSPLKNRRPNEREKEEGGKLI